MRTAPPKHVFAAGLVAALLLLLSAGAALAESEASARLRALAEASLAAQNATSQEQSAAKDLKERLDSKQAGVQATGEAAIELGRAALSQGRAGEARSLGSAVLGLVKESADAQAKDTPLMKAAKGLIDAAFSVQDAYASASPSTGRSLPYIDTDGFDRKLSDSLDAKPGQQEVSFPTPVPMAKLPERLDKWLSAIEESGGRVEAKPMPTPGRSFLGDLISLVLHAYERYQASQLLKPAASYDATVYYDAESKNLARISFTLRSRRAAN